MFRRTPLVMGYDVVGAIDQLGDDVRRFSLGDRVANLTVVGSNASYRTLRARNLVRVPAGVDPAEAAALILSWTTAYQLLHRGARVRKGQRVLVQGGAGAVGQAMIVLGRLAELEIWSTARAEHADLVRELGATPIDFTRVLPDGFDAVFDGLGYEGYDRAFLGRPSKGAPSNSDHTAAVRRQPPPKDKRQDRQQGNA
jgi:NADPH:quinone reductase